MAALIADWIVGYWVLGTCKVAASAGPRITPMQDTAAKTIKNPLSPYTRSVFGENILSSRCRQPAHNKIFNFYRLIYSLGVAGTGYSWSNTASENSNTFMTLRTQTAITKDHMGLFNGQKVYPTKVISCCISLGEMVIASSEGGTTKRL